MKGELGHGGPSMVRIDGHGELCRTIGYRTGEKYGEIFLPRRVQPAVDIQNVGIPEPGLLWGRGRGKQNSIGGSEGGQREDAQDSWQQIRGCFLIWRHLQGHRCTCAPLGYPHPANYQHFSRRAGRIARDMPTLYPIFLFVFTSTHSTP